MLTLKEMRKEIFLAAYGSQAGHLASSFSSLEILYTLYLRHAMHYDIDNFDTIKRDHFILSKGHAALALYVVLMESGFITNKELSTYCQFNSIIGGEPYINIAGIEASTGSLGHGLSLGIGMALASRLDGIDNKTFVLLGDGEIQEGTVWEAATSASQLKLNNLVAILDCNRIQKMDFIDQITRTENWSQKWEAFGWIVDDVDGHSVDELYNCLTRENETDKPRIIIAHTIKGKGVSIMENNPAWHYKMPNKKQLQTFMRELDITEEEILQCKKPS